MIYKYSDLKLEQKEQDIEIMKIIHICLQYLNGGSNSISLENLYLYRELITNISESYLGEVDYLNVEDRVTGISLLSNMIDLKILGKNVLLEPKLIDDTLEHSTSLVFSLFTFIISTLTKMINEKEKN